MTSKWKISKRYADGQPSEYRLVKEHVTIVIKHIYGSYGWSYQYNRKGTRHVISGPWSCANLDIAKTRILSDIGEWI